jgi:tight adherence protein B
LNPTLMTALAFLAGASAVGGVYSILSDLFLRERTRVDRRLREASRTRDRDKARRGRLFKDLVELKAWTEAEEPDATSLNQKFESMVEQSGLNWSVNRLLALVAGVGLGIGIALGLLRQSVLIGVIGGLLSACVPLVYVQTKQKARRNKLLAQLPDAFDLMARVIRAGQTLSQALQAVADEFEPPLAAEFTYCYEQQNMGLSPELALRELARRTGVLEMKIFVLAVLVQQQTGGNLAELLEKLAGIVRQRFRMRARTRALTAEGRLQAGILIALVPALFVIMLAMNRGYAEVLLDRPLLLVITGLAEGGGALWIHKIVTFDF